MQHRRPIAVAAVLCTLGILAVGAAASKRRAVERLNLAGRTDDLPFSHVVVAGDTIYLSGGLGLDKATGRPPAAARDEARLAMDDLVTKLRLAGASPAELVSVQIFSPDLSLYETFNDVYRGYFDGAFPARSFIGSGPLLRGCRFEINGVAVRKR